jgi:hypothetical protein
MPILRAFNYGADLGNAGRFPLAECISCPGASGAAPRRKMPIVQRERDVQPRDDPEYVVWELVGRTMQPAQGLQTRMHDETRQGGAAKTEVGQAERP